MQSTSFAPHGNMHANNPARAVQLHATLVDPTGTIVHAINNIRAYNRRRASILFMTRS